MYSSVQRCRRRGALSGVCSCRLVLDCPADDLAAGGARADLLERLRALRFLSSAVGACAVSTALPPGAHDPEHVVAGVPFMVRGLALRSCCW